MKIKFICSVVIVFLCVVYGCKKEEIEEVEDVLKGTTWIWKGSLPYYEGKMTYEFKNSIAFVYILDEWDDLDQDGELDKNTTDTVYGTYEYKPPKVILTALDTTAQRNIIITATIVGDRMTIVDNIYRNLIFVKQKP
jgi:hypothetical protein